MAAFDSGDTSGGRDSLEKDSLDLSEILREFENLSTSGSGPDQDSDTDGVATVREIPDRTQTHKTGDPNDQTCEGHEHEGEKSPNKRDLKETIGRAVDIVTAAVETDKRKSFREAFHLYKRGIQLFLTSYKDESCSDRVKVKLIEKIKSYLTRAEHIKIHLENDGEFTCTMCKDGKKVREKEKFNDFFNGFVLQDSDKRKLAEVVGNETARTKMMECVILPFKFPHLFTGLRRPQRVFLLFGHPGTGKTMILSATASEIPDVTFLRISVFDLIAKYIGLEEEEDQRIERNIRELFRFANEKLPCVLCIEDLDKLEDTVANQNAESKMRQIKTELLVQLHNLYQQHSNLVVIFQTQKPWIISGTFRRRISPRVLTDLPTFEDRVNILKSNLADSRHSMTEEDFQQVGERTLFPGGHRCTQADLVVLCRDALMQPLRRIQQATHFKQVCHPETRVEGYWAPCPSHEDGAVKMSWMELRSNMLLEPVLEMSDMMKSLEQFQGSVDAEADHRMQQWIQDFI